MRDRLIKLTKASLIRHIDKSCKLAENIADDLLADGVIVPPVRVGQTVYRTRGNFGNIKIYKGFINCVIVEHDKMWFYVHGHPLHFTEDDLGVNVFLTYDEAEKALAEVSNET